MADDEKDDKKKKDLATKTEQMPDYIKRDGGGVRGGENVTVKDIAFPRLQIAQSMSPCMKESDPAYIDGIKEGDIYNTLTRENYGQEVIVVPVYFTPRFVCWRTRATGGGFRGSFATEAEAKERMQLGAQNGEMIEPVITHEYLVLAVTEDGARTEQALVSMSRTQLKKSKNWNSLMLGTHRDFFADKYRLTTVTESNTRGTYKNWNAAPAGYTKPEAVYKEAEALYEQVKEGLINIVAADDEAVSERTTDY